MVLLISLYCLHFELLLSYGGNSQLPKTFFYFVTIIAILEQDNINNGGRQ